MDCTETDIEAIKEWLKANLTEERYLHSLGTMDAAGELALKFCLDTEKAKIAGLIHDCAKCLSKEELKNILENEIKDIDPNILINPKTWHAPVGAHLAKKKFNINDLEILSAIKCHTLGKTNMTDFEKAIFIADKIEKITREDKYRDKIIKTLKKTNCLDKTMLKCFKLTLKSLVKRKLPICNETICVYNELLSKTEES